MIDPRIPDEAVEAAAKAAYENLRPKRQWQQAGYIYQQECRRDARAAIAAAINAWPGRGMRTIMDANGSYPTIFLPLPAPEEKP
jgi:hypothetical protein